MANRLLNDFYNRARAFLVGRASSYARLFHPDQADAKVVLRDLAKFCRAHTSTASKDALVAARLDGRREVWLRIQNHMNLDTHTLWLLYDGSAPPNPQRNDQ